MKKFTYLFFTLIVKISFAQFPEIDFRFLDNVSKVETWRYNLNLTTKKVTDSCLYTMQKYSSDQLLIEYRQYALPDTTQYSSEIYSYEPGKKTISYNSTYKTPGCPFYGRYGKKKEIYGNEFGQLVKEKIYGDTEGYVQIIYEYDTDKHLYMIKELDKKTMTRYYKIKYYFEQKH